MTQAQTVSRRSFIKASSAVSAGGFLMGVSIASGPARAAGMMYTPNAWVPPVIGPALIEAETRKQFGELRREILRRSAEQAGSPRS